MNKEIQFLDKSELVQSGEEIFPLTDVASLCLLEHHRKPKDGGLVYEEDDFVRLEAYRGNLKMTGDMKTTWPYIKEWQDNLRREMHDGSKALSRAIGEQETA